MAMAAAAAAAALALLTPCLQFRLMSMKAATLFLIFAFCPLVGWSQSDENRALETRQSPKTAQDVEFNRLYQGCLGQLVRDQLCQMVIATKQVGDDALEAVKELVPMGPLEYTLMTAANVAYTGRLRVKVPSPFPKWEGTFDFNRDATTQIVFQKNF
jgi:hypothetical protein